MAVNKRKGVPRLKKGATLADIAAAVGVSSSTVSMILSGKNNARFSPDTVREVQQAACRLGYTKRNRVIPQGDGRMILVICPSIANPYYTTLIQGIEQATHAGGYTTVLMTTYWDTNAEKRIINSVHSYHVAGVIFAMVPQLTDLAEKLSKTVPVVAVGDRNNDLDLATADVNNFQSGVLVAEHLISLGHRHIAYISTPLNEDHSARVRRLEGLRNTFANRCPNGTITVRTRSVTPDEELAQIDLEHDVGFELTKTCLSNKKITAFVAINDMVAYGVMDALIDAGYSIPQDYSVCGFDNIFPSHLAPVALTSVDHSIASRGQAAFRLLLDKMNEKPAFGADSITRVEYQSRLVVRGSTAVPSAEKLQGAD